MARVKQAKTMADLAGRVVMVTGGASGIGLGHQRGGGPSVSSPGMPRSITIPTTLLDSGPVGHLDINTRIRLDHALRYTLDIQC